LLIFSQVAQAQKKKQLFHKDPLGFVHVDTTVNNQYYSTVIEREGYKPMLVRMLICGKADCTYMAIYKPSPEALNLYGVENIIRIKLKPGVDIINMDQILTLYQIPKEYSHLSIFIDKHEINHPHPLFAVRSDVDSVKVITNPENNQKFISIITNN
jgi:hypothetical protein